MSASKRSALGVALGSVVALSLFVGAGSPLTSCYTCNYPCPGAFDVGSYCQTASAPDASSACLFDGLPLSQCDAGSCSSWTLSSGDTLSIPVGALWPTLGARDDLHWFVDCLPPGTSLGDGSVLESSVSEASAQETSTPEASTLEASPLEASTGFVAPSSAGTPGTLTVLFDGSPAQGCICIPQIEISCDNVPTSVQTIGLNYVQGPGTGGDAGSARIPLSIAFDVGECAATRGGCPHSDVPEGSAY